MTMKNWEAGNIYVIKSLAGDMIIGKFTKLTEDDVYFDRPYFVGMQQDPPSSYKLVINEYLPVWEDTNRPFNRKNIDTYGPAKKNLADLYEKATTKLIKPIKPKIIIDANQ